MQEEPVILFAAQSFRDLRNAPVVITVLQRSGRGFVGLIGGDVSKLLVESQSSPRFVRRSFFAIQPSAGGVSLRRSHSVFVNGPPGEFASEAAEPFSDRLRDQ